MPYLGTRFMVILVSSNESIYSKLNPSVNRELVVHVKNIWCWILGDC